MDFRTKLKESTSPYHDALESQFPFNTLLTEENIERNSQFALICFKAMFINTLKQLKDKNAFFNHSFHILNEVDDAQYSIKNMQTHLTHDVVYDSLNELAHTYLFIGSRMGNRLAIQKNPKLLETGAAKYFQMEMPANLWREILQNINLLALEKQDQLIQLVIKAFKDLTDIGAQLEAKIMT